MKGFPQLWSTTTFSLYLNNFSPTNPSPFRFQTKATTHFSRILANDRIKQFHLKTIAIQILSNPCVMAGHASLTC
jgi:hypothetical protein